MGRDPLPASLACVDALLLPSLWSMRAELSRLGRGLQAWQRSPRSYVLPATPAPYFLLESWLAGP